MSLWVVRIFFLTLCILGGYAVSQVRPDVIENGPIAGVMIGFGLGGLLIGIDVMLKGFSLRAFSAATFGLFLGTLTAWMIDGTKLFLFAPESTLWLVRLCLFLGFGYIGMVMAMRSNKEDFSLIIPFVRFTSQNQTDNLLLLDTSAIIDGRIAEMIEANFLEGVVVVPRFVLKELHQIADSKDPIRRARGRRGMEMLSRLQKNKRNEIKIHEGDIAEEPDVDAKLVRLAKTLNAKLFTHDYNLGKVAELQSVNYVNISELAKLLKPVILPANLLACELPGKERTRGRGLAI